MNFSNNNLSKFFDLQKKELKEALATLERYSLYTKTMTPLDALDILLPDLDSLNDKDKEKIEKADAVVREYVQLHPDEKLGYFVVFAM